MGLLNDLNITASNNNKAASIFESLFPSFMDIEYNKPSEYVQLYWCKYESRNDRNSNLNGKIFEYIIITLCIREGILPLYVNAKVAFVPNVNYDLIFYTNEHGPICFSIKTSLRERYKQADLEAIALKYVHRKSLNYLLTLHKEEAYSVKEKIKAGSVIGINDVLLATESSFDDLIFEMKEHALKTSPTVEVVKSHHLVTKELVDSVFKS